MIHVTVTLSAQLRTTAGSGSLTLEVEEGCTVRALVRRLAGEKGDAFRRMVLADDGEPRPSILLFVGDEQVRNGAERILADGEEVFLTTPVAGG